MRTLTCLMMLAGCALAGRLENTYLPPPGAAQAGGVNLAAPYSGASPASPQNTYLPPTAIRANGAVNAGSAFNSGSAFNAGSSAFNAGSSAFNTGSSGFKAGGNAFNSGSGSISSSSASSFGAAGRFGVQQQQAQQVQVASYSGSSSFQQATPRPALIIKQVNENPGDGTYTFSYETENGIQAQEQGQIRADGAEGLAAVQGAYAFTAPDNNIRYTVTYTADENGFLAYGDHLPTPPPVPAEIQRALEQNAADEARGLVDDGQYRAEHQGQQQGGFLRGGSSSGSVGYSSGSSSSGGYSSGSSSSSSNGGYSSGSSSGSNSGYHY